MRRLVDVVKRVLPGSPRAGTDSPGGGAPGRRGWFSSFNLVDWLNFAYFGYLSVAILVRYDRVPGADKLLAGHALYLAGMVALARGVRRDSPALLRFLRCFYPLLFITPIYRETELLMRLYHDRWYDALVVAFEQGVFGVEPNLALERVTSRPLTELMKVFYASYFLLVPLVPLYLWGTGNRRGFYDYMVTGTLALFACYVGFTLFPVQGPRYFLGFIPWDRHFSVPLEPNALGLAFQQPVLQGYVVSALVDQIMRNADATGACIPSAHNAMSIAVLGVVRRHLPAAFPFVCALVAGIVVATVYNRYHYTLDAVSGILVGIAALGVSGVLLRRPGHDDFIRP
jgi:hypothetical protein